MKKIYWLEGLRGLAALIVAIGHFKLATFQFHSEYPIFHEPNTSILQLLFVGTMPVHLFFLLSGRVLTLSILEKGPTLVAFKSLSSAIFRRPLRLAFPVYCGLFLALTLQYFGAFDHVIDGARLMNDDKNGSILLWLRKPLEKETITDFTGFLEFTAAFFTNSIFTKMGAYPLAVVWTIPVELVGSWYIFLTTAVVLFLKQSRRWIVYLSMILFLWWTNSWFYLFLIGLWFADISLTGAFSKFQDRSWMWFVRAALLFMALAPTTKQLPLFNFFNSFQGWQMYSDPGNNWVIKPFVLGGKRGESFIEPDNYLGISSTATMLLFEVSPQLQWFFSTKPFKFLGNISYGLYLGHPFVLLLLQAPLFKAFHDLGWNFLDIVYTTFPIYIFWVVIIGYVFTIAFDKPSIELAHKIRAWCLEPNIPKIKAPFSENEEQIYPDGIKVVGDEGKFNANVHSEDDIVLNLYQ